MTRQPHTKLPLVVRGTASGRLLITLAAVAVTGALTGYALAGSSGTGTDSFAAESTVPSALWSWGAGVVPGAPVSATANVRTSASQSGVASGSLREPAAASDGLTIVFGENAAGELCSAGYAPAFVSGFTCLSGWTDNFALLYYGSDGGVQQGVVDHASVVGVARPDVARVSVTTPSGTSNLPLNSWDGFSYAASSPSQLPLSLTAYGADGAVLDSQQVESVPTS